MIVVDNIVFGRCVTAQEVAQRLGISVLTARKRLKRMERRGLLERKMVGRVAVYCVGEGAEVAHSPPAPVPSLGPKAETQRRMEEVVRLVERGGCVTTSLLQRSFGINHVQAFYVLRLLQAEGAVVEVVLGNTALWCRDRKTATELMTRLRETVHRLALENKMRYAAPRRILQAALGDRDAYKLLSRFVSLRPNMRSFPPATLALVSDILKSLYGEPLLRTPRKAVYVVSQPREFEIAVRDGGKKTVAVEIPSDLAAALRGADANEIVLQAIEQLLARFRT